MKYAAARPILIDNGYSVLPVLAGDKRPACSGWTDPRFTAPIRDFDECGIGVLCGRGSNPIAGVDIDILDAKIAAAVGAMVERILGPSLLRFGRPPKRLYVFRYDKPGIAKMQSKKYRCGRLEVLGSGQYFVAYGIHPDTKKPYMWDGADLSDTLIETLPVITEAQVRKLFECFHACMAEWGFTPIEDQQSGAAGQPYDAADPLDHVGPLDIERDRLEAAVRDIDPDCSRAVWIKVGMALHHQSEGEDWGFELWDDWSQGGAKYVAGQTEKYWPDFGRPDRRPVTAAYILKEAKAAREAARVAESTPSTTAAVPAPSAVEDNPFRGKNWSTSRFVGLPPPRQMVFDGLLPKGIVGMLHSAGGVGKSTLALAACVKISMAHRFDADFLGYPCVAGTAVIVTAEDPEDELHRRLLDAVEAAAAEIDEPVEDVREAVDERLSIIDTHTEVIHLFSISDGNLHTTKRYDQLIEVLEEMEDVQLIIIDTKSRYSPAEGAGNVIATQEIMHYEKIAQRTGATVMFLHHDNKVSRGMGLQSSGHGYRDSTATYDTVRASWHLVTLSEQEAASQGITNFDGKSFLMLNPAKTSYLPPIRKQLLTRCGGGFTAQPIIPKPSDVKASERAQADIDAAVEILQGTKGEVVRQADLLRMCAEQGIPRVKAQAALRDAKAMGLISKKGEKTPVVEYFLTDEGARYNLTLEETE